MEPSLLPCKRKSCVCDFAHCLYRHCSLKVKLPLLWCLEPWVIGPRLPPHLLILPAKPFPFAQPQLQPIFKKHSARMKHFCTSIPSDHAHRLYRPPRGSLTARLSVRPRTSPSLGACKAAWRIRKLCFEKQSGGQDKSRGDRSEA